MTPEQLRDDYALVRPRAERLKNAVLHEIEQLLEARTIALGVPLEARVKRWASIEEKLERKALALDNVASLDDLVGVRTILLFRSDLEPAIAALSETFNVLSIEDTGARLQESQFGYQSQHLIVQFPAQWASIPSLKDLTDLRIEIQVRTLAQHIWAAASHKLQYKQEQSVPPPLRRTIFRISALLETVDLELDRVLDERSSYATTVSDAREDQRLDVDLLASVLESGLPLKNKGESENYSDLLNDLFYWKIETAEQLSNMLARNRQKILAEEASRVAEERDSIASGKDVAEASVARIDQGVYFTHAGLTRNALRFEKGEHEVDEYLLERATNKVNTKRVHSKKEGAAKEVVASPQKAS